jgi:hypothetical protein
VRNGLADHLHGLGRRSSLLTDRPFLLPAAYCPLPTAYSSLGREIHAAQEVLEAWFRAKAIELRVNSKKGHPCTPFGKGPFKPCQGLVLFTKSSIN